MFKIDTCKIWYDREGLKDKFIINLKEIIIKIVEDMKEGEENVKVFISIVLIINAIYIVYLDLKVHKLEDKLLQARIDAIKEINKLRKKD